ncbi:glycosyltransferase family 4 protein [Chromobacterium violaceum]|uniref:glycosyltransferase family 4 protein n=1 Tax=Chromobacterium violaceum TaxID=536 RepID=UPI0035A74080
MKIVVVTTYFSKGMGYTENCLPRALAKMGHEVHVVTSEYNIYGNASDYNKNYQNFLGDAIQPVGSFEYDGYMIHRLRSRNMLGYIKIIGLVKKIRELNPDVVHSVAIASLQTYLLALGKISNKFLIFTENHHHMSVVKPFLLNAKFQPFKKSFYWLTRTLPTWLASFAVERCYAVAPDCLEVANRFYGVPHAKIALQSLGTDTELFRPALTKEEKLKRDHLRASLGLDENDLVCVYTGRFTKDKNPALLAKAMSVIASKDNSWKAIFVGEGIQRSEIANGRNCMILPFMRHAELADLYRAADIAVWPRQESMSMLDAASCGLPLVVADSIGESKRVQGNGVTYPENDLGGLILALESLSSSVQRKRLGAAGRDKMIRYFSWDAVARRYVQDYEEALLS